MPLYTHATTEYRDEKAPTDGLFNFFHVYIHTTAHHVKNNVHG